jgi:kynurenine 3-monooxygenase
MCRPPNSIEKRHVIISGAGPAGLLLQALLHHRNKSSSPPPRVIYETTLIESRADLGILSQDELQSSHRSWMIGLANHGLEAIRTVPGLFEDYISGICVSVEELHIYLGSKRINGSQPKLEGSDTVPENFIVDRNFVVAALSRYGNEVLKNSNYYHSKYEHEIMYVDHENHRVLVRSKRTREEEYIPYDLLVGADGVRSTVRDALVKKHFDFELSISDIFQSFKAVHIARPEELSPTSLSVLPGCLPHFNGIVLPETGGIINLSMGTAHNHFEKDVDDEIKSENPDVICAYFKKNFKAFKLTEEGYMDLAQQWVNQRWNRTGMVHCNRYSSVECKIVLMGDAAHATSPSIGMGMNTALRDAQKLYELLDKYEDDLGKVLPEYSRIRVPEGNALSDLALHLYCFDTKLGAISMLKSVARDGLNKLFPWLVRPDCQAYIGRSGYSLADAYQKAVEQGILSKHRTVNERIRQEFFERQTGMIVDKPNSSLLKYSLAIPAVVAVCGIFMKIKNY